MMKKRYLILAGIIVIIAFFHFDKKSRNKLNKRALNNLNLHLIGVVKDVEKLNRYNGTGIITLKILSSNISSYDPRNTLEYYYCIIKNGGAEVYDGNADECFIGDTLKIDTKLKIISWLNKNKQDQKFTIWVNTDDDFYKYAASHHQKW